MTTRLSDERLAALLETVSKVGAQPIPPNTPCFWGPNDKVACTYDDLRSLIVELQARRESPTGLKETDPKFHETDRQMHQLWTWAVGLPGYDKRAWQKLEQGISELAKRAARR